MGCRRTAWLMLVVVFVTTLSRGDEPSQGFQVADSLVSTLMEKKWWDLAMVELEGMEHDFPEQQTLVNLRKPFVLLALGKREQADAVFNQVSADETYKKRALLTRAEYTLWLQEKGKAIELYTKYFKQVPSSKDDPGTDSRYYMRGLGIVLNLKQQRGDADVGWLIDRINEEQKLAEPGAGDAEGSERGIAFLKVQARLEAQEKAVEDGRKPDPKQLNAIVEELKRLRASTDMVAALCYVELARAYGLLGKFDDAISQLEVSKDFLLTFDRGLRREGKAKDSPVAPALLYWGKALRGQARAAHKKGQDEKVCGKLLDALKKFKTISLRYAEAKPYADDAVVEFEKTKDLFSKVDCGKVEDEADAGRSTLLANVKKATPLFEAKQYGKAIPLLSEAITAYRSGEEAKEAAYMLVSAYAETGQFLRAEVVASLMRDLYPSEEPRTADAHLRLAGALNEEAKRLKSTNPAQAARVTEEVMNIIDLFADQQPTHPQSQKFAYTVAEHAYGKAIAALKESKQIENAAAREKKKEEARRLFEAAIPKYQRVVDQYGGLTFGVRSTYKLAWCHYNLGNNRQAADAFARYAETETSEEYADDRAEARFRVGEMLLKTEPLAAARTLRTLLDEIDKDAIPGLSRDKRTQIELAARSMFAWAYQQKSETYRDAINAFRARIREIEDTIDEQELVIEQAQQAEKQAEQAIARAEKDAKEMEEVLRGATQQLDPGGETENVDTSTMSEEELAFHRQTLAERQRNRAQADEARIRLQLEGQKQEFERLAKEAEIELVAVGERREELAAEGDRLTALQQELNTAREKAVAREEELAKRIEAAEIELEKARTSVDELNQKITEAKEQEDAREKSVREAATKLRTELEAQLEPATKRLGEANERYQAQAGEAVRTELTEVRTQILDVTRKLADTATAIDENRRERELADKRRAAVEAARAAYLKAVALNDLKRKLADQQEGEDGIEDLVAQIARATEDAVSAFQARLERITEEQVKIKSFGMERAARANQIIAECRRKIEAVEAEQKPVQAEMSQWKEKAAQAFENFLKAHPQEDNYSPANMAALGSIYLELNRFDEAVRWMGELRSRYPDSKAGQSVLFDMGRAQFESKDVDGAAKTFGDVLASSTDVAASNIRYIADTMLESGNPTVARKAAEELIRRSEDPRADDHAVVKEKLREYALRTAGLAALQEERYEDAIGHLEKLVSENDKTAYFFDAMFALGRAYMNKPQPELETARKRVSKVTLYAQEAPILNRAYLLLGEIRATDGSRDEKRKALARYRQVYALADPAVPENLPLIEIALYRAAVLAEEIDDRKTRDEAVEQYLRDFPNGKHRKQLQQGGASAAAPSPAPEP